MALSQQDWIPYVVWSAKTRHYLIETTAATMISAGISSTADRSIMMQHFRSAVQTLPFDERRYIPGPSRVLWLEPGLKAIFNPPVAEEIKPVILPISQPASDVTDLLLDGFTSLESKIDQFFVSQSEIVPALIEYIKELGGDIKYVKTVITTKPVVTPFKTLSIGLIGFTGQQRVTLINGTKEFPTIKICFLETHHHLPLCDKYIVGKWAIKSWLKVAGEHKDNCLVLNGTSETIKAIEDLAKTSH